MKIRFPDPSPTAQDDKMSKLQNNSADPAIPAVKKKMKNKANVNLGKIVVTYYLTSKYD
jgi:hypothetical protein